MPDTQVNRTSSEYRRELAPTRIVNMHREYWNVDNAMWMPDRRQPAMYDRRVN